MRTKTDIWADMAAASATSASTDQSRALSGAEWLQQLASELVELIKTDHRKPLAYAADDQSGPGDGWRWLEPGEVIKKGDEHEFLENEWMAVGISIGCEAESKSFRRRI